MLQNKKIFRPKPTDRITNPVCTESWCPSEKQSRYNATNATLLDLKNLL